MNAIFVDTLYIIALFNPRDEWHGRATEVEPTVRGRSFVTTESVLAEVLNYFSSYGAQARRKAVDVINDILNDPQVETVAQTHDRFQAGVALYEACLDKRYSLTNCISMNVMREKGINEVLSHDHHFTQEGFTVLL